MSKSSYQLGIDHFNDKNTTKSTTEDDNKLRYSLLLHEISERMHVVFGELEEIYLSLSDKESSKRTKDGAIKLLKQIILPFIKDSSKLISDAAKTLSPILRLQYVHQRRENDRKRKATSEKENWFKSDYKKNASLKRIENTNLYCVPEPKKSRINTSVKSVPRNQRVLPTINSQIPKPINSVYSKEEVIKILQRFDKNTPMRLQIIDKWVKEGLVPAKRAQIYSLLQKAKMGDTISGPWKTRGRPRLLGETDLNGNTISTEEISKMIKDKTEKKIISDGHVPISQSVEPHRTTLVNYKALLAATEGISIAKSFTHKSNTRFTAENSLISAMSFLVLVACTHYNISLETSINVKNEISEAENGVKMIYDMVSFQNDNLPMFPVKPEYVFSTDDTVNYIFEGTEQKKDLFRLVSSSAISNSGTRSKYKINESNNMNGLRVKLTYTFSAAGTSSPIFVSVCGLTERELPNDKVLALKIEGLCVGGGGISVGNKQNGWLVFVRNDNDNEKLRYKIYRDKVLLPFVNQSRIEFDKWDESSGIIPDELQAVSWCDSDLSQVANIVDPDSIILYEKYKICSNKQNAARSGTEQAADLTKTFKIMQKQCKEVTLNNVPSERHPMKKSIKTEFHLLFSKNRLQLKYSKRNAIIDFVCSIPEISIRAMTRNNIVHGFLENGMIDRQFVRYPDFNKLLSTCRTNPTKDEYDLCIKAFPILYKYCAEHGHIPDKIYEDLGFPLDKDPFGRIVKRDATITQESRQREKCLTHDYQVELRKKQIMLEKAESERKIQDNKTKILKKLLKNRTCEKKNCDMLEKNKQVSEAGIEHFGTCLADELKSFINVLQHDLQTKLPNKGSVDDAKNGNNNLIKMAYELRYEKNHLQKTYDNIRSEQSNNSPTIEDNIIPINITSGLRETSILSSCLLEDKEWVKRVTECFELGCVRKRTISNKISDQIKAQADILNKILMTRFTSHIQQRITNKNKHNHWCLCWFEKNIPQMASIMTLLGHIKTDLQCIDSTTTLLRSKDNFVRVSNTKSQQEGSYLYYDTNNSIWIRSGKVTGRGFDKRHSEHKNMSKQNGCNESKFYLRYPSKCSNFTFHGSRRGYFDNLQQYIAVGCTIPYYDGIIIEMVLFTEIVRKYDFWFFLAFKEYTDRRA